MPRIIFISPHFKSGHSSAAHLSYLIHYIATREGVAPVADTDRLKPATEKQDRLIRQLAKDFPSAKRRFEYEDYLARPTQENASDFIQTALEQNFDQIGKRENYVDYIGMRPGVVKLDAHGLFDGTGKKLVLSQVQKEIAEHPGVVWTPVISLRREDAHAMGFESPESWRAMQTRLRLFLDWGITFDNVYEVPEKAERKVAYADKDELERRIVTRYHSDKAVENVPVSDKRTQASMVLLDVSATGEENVIDEGNREMKDLEYRRKQLKSLQNQVVDLEDISGGISITDMTFNDFKTDLMGYLKDHKKELAQAPAGMLKMGLDLTWPLEAHTYGGKNVYTIGLGALMICLDDHITPAVAEAMRNQNTGTASECVVAG